MANKSINIEQEDNMDFQKTYGSMDPKDHAEWHTFNDAEFFIAPNNTPAFKTAAMKQFGLNDIQSGMEGKSAYEVMKIECAIKAETILLDWKGVTNEGDEVKYSKEKAHEYLLNFEPFREWVESITVKMSADAETKKEAVKKK